MLYSQGMTIQAIALMVTHHIDAAPPTSEDEAHEPHPFLCMLMLFSQGKTIQGIAPIVTK